MCAHLSERLPAAAWSARAAERASKRVSRRRTRSQLPAKPPAKPLQHRDAAAAGACLRGQRAGTITEEELLAISAAVAAYLGVRAHIRQIRLISSRAWAQEGRVSIQASHRLH